MRSNVLNAQLNLAPLLDVVFIALFIVVLNTESRYQNALEDERESAVQTRQSAGEQVRELNTQLDDLQRELTQVRDSESRLARLQEDKEQYSKELMLTLQNKEAVLNNLERTLTDKENNLAQTQARLQKLEAEAEELQQTLKLRRRQLFEKQEALSDKDASLAKLQAELDALQTRNQRLEDYRRQQAEREMQSSDVLENSLKAEFVDKHIDIFRININPAGESRSQLEIIGKNRRRTKEFVANRQQIEDFLRRELNPYEKSKTLIMFVKSPDSLYLHEQWIEDYLDDQGFLVGATRRSL